MKIFILISFILKLATQTGTGTCTLPQLTETYTCLMSSETATYEEWTNCIREQYERPNIFSQSGIAQKNEKSTIGIIKFVVKVIDKSASLAYLYANQYVNNAHTDIKKTLALVKEPQNTKYIKSELTLQRYLEYDNSGVITFDGFQCQISLTVITQMILQLGKIIDAGISKNGMNGISYVSFDILPMRRTQLEEILLTEAINDARVKVALTLKATNQEILSLRGLSVQEPYEPQPNDRNDRFMKADAAASTQIFAADTIVQRFAYLQYYIKP